MDSIVLAGGFATRLYPLTQNTSKPLLKVGGKHVLSYLMDELDRFHRENGGACYLTVNRKFYPDFEKFRQEAKHCPPLEIVVEEATKDSEKPGPMKAIGQVFNEYMRDLPSEGVLIAAGDSVSSIDLAEFLDYYARHRERSVVALYDINDLKKAEFYACAELAEDAGGKRISRFAEKPKPAFSTLVNTTYFILRKAELEMIDDYAASGTKKGLIDWLIDEKVVAVNGFVFRGHWFDIGDFESLRLADNFLSKEKNLR
ncbi:nucleotidyltransferase family protein [Candidatus Woesearchaeota archaeon]|nr:nucleotidyltransferase family protein [Candidatus Woesearchaeota archaeon]